MCLRWSLSVALNARLTLVFATIALAAPLSAHSYSSGQFAAVTTADEAQVDRVRDQEINQLKIVMGRRFAERRRPDILLRLAEIYIEKYRFFFLKENEIYQALLKQGKKPKTVDYSVSRKYLKSATNSCFAILNSRVKFDKMDQVYYFLGYNFEELRQKREAAKYFEIVATRFPNSPYAPEAFRNLAEFAFSKNQFRDAVSYYEKAARYNKVPSYPRTLYKLAWAYFKTRRRAEALATMKKVVEITGSEEKFVGVREEALNDLVAFFAEAGKPKDARDYFESIQGGIDIYVRALKRLAGAYERRGEYRTALNVNNSLMAQYGDKRPDLVYEVLGRDVELYRKLNDGEGEEKALTRLVDYFVAHSDEISKNEESAETVARAKSYLRGRATEIHKEARKKQKKQLYSRAADLYGLYLKAFLAKPSDSKQEREAAEIRTYRSDALLAAGRENEALPELENTLRNEGDAKLKHVAGTTLLNILIKKVDAARSQKGSALENAERQFMSVAAAFEEAFPNDKLVAELGYKKARLSAVKSGPEGLSSEARRALAELIEKYPARTESAEAAAELVADALKREKSDDAVELAKKFLANGVLLKADKKGELSTYLKAVIGRQDFKGVQEIEKDNDYAKAASEYERLANSSSTDKEVVQKSLNNAAVNYERAGRRDDAVRVLTLMMNRYKSNAAPRAELKRLASTSLWESRFDEAARLYARLATIDDYSVDERMSFVRTAFWLDWGRADFGAAFIGAHRGLRELCEAVKRPFADERCHDLALDLARLMLDAKRYQEAVNHLRSYASKKVSGSRRAEAHFLLGQIYQNELRDPRKAAMSYEEAARAVPRSGSKSSASHERNFAAHAAFLLVEPHFSRFTAIKLELPEAKLKTNTRAKLSALESLVTRYSNVVGYGDGEWGIAALERLYDAFSSFASELESAPVPSKLDEAGKQQYRRGIQQISQPMVARAVEYLKQGYQKGLQLEVTTPTFIALTQRLSRQFPREYPPAHYAMVVDGGVSRQSTLRLSGTSETGDLEGWRKKIAAKLVQNPKAPETWVEFGNLESLAGRLKIARLLYEQSASLSAKNANAQANLSVVLFLEQHPLEATQGMARAANLSEFNKDIRFNLAKSLLAFHHFAPALKHLRPLAARFPDDKEISEALVTSLLGSGQVSQAGAIFNQIDAKGSSRFSLWYNWSIWALLGTDADDREDALEMLKERRQGLSALERSQVDLALVVFGK